MSVAPLAPGTGFARAGRKRGAQIRIQVVIAAAQPTPDLDSLRGALEAFLDSRPRDDVLAVAEAECCLQRALFVPQVVEAAAQTLELGSKLGVIAPGKGMPQLGPTLARLLDLVVDLRQGHVRG